MGGKEIVYRIKRSVGLVLATAWLSSAALANGAAAQETGAESLEITPSRGSEVSGTATLKDVEGGVEVAVDVEGLPEGGGEYVHHVHEGATCEEDKVGDGGPIEFPLDEIAAGDDGTGSATSVVEGLTLSELLDGGKERFVNFHPKPPEGASLSSGIACTTLAPTAGSSDLPESGGVRPAVALSGAVTLVAGATAIGALVLRRRNA